MKVLYFHQHFTTPAGSGGTRSHEFACELVARGHQVTMVCGTHRLGGLNLKSPLERGRRRGSLDGIDVIEFELDYSNYDSLMRRSAIFFRFALRSIGVALREDYDLLFATSTPLTAGIPGIAMKVLGRRKPFIFEVRDLWPELPRAMGVVKNPLVLAGLSALEWLSYRCADACVALSPGIAKGIARRSRAGQRIEIIPNGCDLELFKPGNRADLALPGIGPRDTVAVFTGAHGIANGLDAVLDAAAVLKARGRTDIKLVFIGDGKLKPCLQQRARDEQLDSCLFLDPMPKTRLNTVVSNADIGLMILQNVPAFYYGTSPNKFFDYLSAGLPVLNNYPGWLANLITTHRCGLAVPPDDARAFADALITLADDAGLRREMSANARGLATREFDRHRLAEAWVQLLEAVLQQRPATGKR
jgi:glycosyltransferase involved in cell wall biosynthesis